MVFYKITEDTVILKCDQDSFKKALLEKFEENNSIFNISWVIVYSLNIYLISTELSLFQQHYLYDTIVCLYIIHQSMQFFIILHET